MRKQASIGQRGKYAEGKVRDLLQQLSDAHAEFDFARIYDARSSHGSIPAQPGDFSFCRPDAHGLIEAKEIEHNYRLPRDKLSQIPGLQKRELAGGRIVVLVLHTEIERWRSVPFKWLLERRALPSWDLSEFPTYKRLTDIPGLVASFIGLKGLKTA